MLALKREMANLVEEHESSRSMKGIALRRHLSKEMGALRVSRSCRPGLGIRSTTTLPFRKVLCFLAGTTKLASCNQPPCSPASCCSFVFFGHGGTISRIRNCGISYRTRPQKSSLSEVINMTYLQVLSRYHSYLRSLIVSTNMQLKTPD